MTGGETRPQRAVTNELERMPGRGSRGGER